MINIHFIVNPIAGRGKPDFVQTFIESFIIGSLHRLTIKYSEYKKHAIILTMESIAEKADIIVACGGDGTINEVASCLVDTSIPLGILPMDSMPVLSNITNLHRKERCMAMLTPVSHPFGILEKIRICPCALMI